ncbi:MAG TPA: toll/interleukin-1 receptor domain-containing protein [Vicinamibacterales bacterium]|nr:toll/interleukin-1 receptor domain-containing protein [Vicinamibacterales bacterium]
MDNSELLNPPRSHAPGYDLFLSHNRRQKPWVRTLVAFLRNHGLRVFFDEDSIEPGEDVVSALERAIESSNILVLVLSRSSVFSKWVTFETAVRLYEDPECRLRRLIPVLVEPVDRTLIRSAVRRLDAVDLTDPETREREFLHFLKTIGAGDVTANDFPPWPEPSSIDELHVADIDNVASWQWSGEELLNRLIALDREMFQGISDAHEGNATQWAPVFMDHPDTWRLVITPANQIIGYWHFVPLFDDTYESARAGELMDSEITTDKVRVFEFPGDYKIYLVSIGLLPRYRRTKAFILMLNSLFDILLTLARDGIFISSVLANAYTESGIAMSRTFGMTRHGRHREQGDVFESAMVDILRQQPCRDYTELRRLYSEHYSLPDTADDQVRSP